MPSAFTVPGRVTGVFTQIEDIKQKVIKSGLKSLALDNKTPEQIKILQHILVLWDAEQEGNDKAITDLRLKINSMIDDL